MLVLDASAAFNACLAEVGFAHYRGEQLVAPPLLWSEVRSSLHEARWRGVLEAAVAGDALERLERAPIRARSHRHLGPETWHVADELGWAKTYDAEYVALARLLDCRLVTLDDALRRAAGRLAEIVGPADL